MAFSIPVRMLAVAASVASRLYYEREEDVFDHEKWSRARMIAIAAIKRVFPTASQASIARCFGMILHDAKRIGIDCERSRNSGWWSDDAVETVYRAVKHLGGYNDDFLPEDLREPRVELAEEKGAVFTPRKVTDARKVRLAPIIHRPSNVTAALLGDPPPGRREFLKTTHHANFAWIKEGDMRKDSRGRKEPRGRY